MSNVMPLHVQVAIAIGASEADVECLGPRLHGGPGHVPGTDMWVVRKGPGYDYVPRYDTNWAAGGPLVERYELQVGPRSLDGNPR